MEREEFEKKLNEHAWKDESFKKELLANPKAALEQELGTKLPARIQVKLVEETADTVYVVLRRNPSQVSAKGELTDEAVEAAAGGTAVAGSWYAIVKAALY